MENNPVSSPVSYSAQNKDTYFNGIKPPFDFSDIEKDANKYLNNNEVIETEKNRFPVEVFPAYIQQIILATNESLNFPNDFIGSSMLYAVSVAIGNTYKVEIKKGFQESAVLYLAIVARAGTNKSHPLSFAVQPIIEQDKKTYREYEQRKQEYDNETGLKKSERRTKDPLKPVWQKTLLSDFTPEALAEIHKYNKRGIGVYIDELAGWFKNFNRYNKGSEMEFWLSVWNSKPINIDRKSGEPVFIPLPFISVAGTIQNGVLNELAKESRTQNGFIDRILFVIPDNVTKPYWSDTDINPVIIQNWQSIVSKILGLPIKYDETLNPVPEILLFTPEAKKIFFSWQKDNADQCNQAESEAISGIYSKLEMYVARLALILEIMRWSCNESDKQVIGVEAIEGALKLIEYFKKSAVKVYSIISNSNPLDKFPADKQTLYKALPDYFTTDTGLQVAESLGVPERTFKRFLNERNLFNNVSRGEYEKRI
jgi:hypothetical protein